MAPILELRKLIQRTVSIFTYLDIQTCHIQLQEKISSDLKFQALSEENSNAMSQRPH